MKSLLNALLFASGLMAAGASNATIIDFSTESGTLNTVSDVTFDRPGVHSSIVDGFVVANNGGAAGNYVYNSFGEDMLGFTFAHAVMLNRLDITRDPMCCGGSGNASVNILLFDALNNLISNTAVGGGTAWQTIIFNQQNVFRVVFDVAAFYNPYDLHAGDHDWFGLDNIVFDEYVRSVPGPSTIALLGLGALAFGIVRRRKKT